MEQQIQKEKRMGHQNTQDLRISEEGYEHAEIARLAFT